jgi:hypothetical protein
MLKPNGCILNFRFCPYPLKGNNKADCLQAFKLMLPFRGRGQIQAGDAKIQNASNQNQ